MSVKYCLIDDEYALYLQSFCIKYKLKIIMAHAIT